MTDTSTDLLPIPATGEALDLSAPDEDLVVMFDHVRGLERQLKEAREVIAQELTLRMDKRAKWSFEASGYKVSVASPAMKEEWDLDALRATLADLRDQGLDEDAIDAALDVQVIYKPRAVGLNALRKLGGEVEERINSCRAQVEPVRRISVKLA